MLEPSLGGGPEERALSHKCGPHSAHGHGELSLGRSADLWRVTEARNHRLRTHGVAVSARPTDDTVADLEDIPGESHWQPGVHLDGDAKRTRQARLVSSVAIVSVVWFASTSWRRKIIFRTLHA